MLEWEKLLCDRRRKDKSGKGGTFGTGGSRAELVRDYDRILFASPTRRLADKTQVFPLDPIDSVRTRLTHSHEVANLARSVGMSIAFDPDKVVVVFGETHEELDVKRKVPALLAAIGLAHDLGNPPFGHQGEMAIKRWFKSLSASGQNVRVHPDHQAFDGNPQSFRLLTRLQILNDDYGLNLTYATLAAMVKYPWFASSKRGKDQAKFGIFASEKAIIQEVWQETGLAEGIRHPFAYILDACDDIAYAVIDAEDIVKKGYASFYDLMDHLQDVGDDVSLCVVKKARAKNSEFKKEHLGSSELNEISMQMFRVFAIDKLITAVTACFVEKVGTIMSGKVAADLDLVKASKAAQLCDALKKFGKRHGFGRPQVLELELRGSNHIHSTMHMLWQAIREEDKNEPFSRYAWATISENYRRVHKSSAKPRDYKDCQLLCDFVSGMTDSFLMRTHDKLRPLYDGLPQH